MKWTRAGALVECAELAWRGGLAMIGKRAMLLVAAVLVGCNNQSPQAEAGAESAPDPAGVPAMGEAPISRSVWATWVAETEDDVPTRLLLVVLWKGREGWYDRSIRGTTQFTPDERAASQDGSARRHPYRISMEYEIGSVRLAVEFDANRRTATIAGRTLDLGERNVVLVDLADVRRGPSIVGSARIDPQVPAPRERYAPPNLSEALGQSDVVRSFLSGDSLQG